MGDIREYIAILGDALPGEKERRRYALLQAAATIFVNERAEVRRLLASGEIEEEDVTDACVDWADSLLAEIEKREKAEEES